MKQFIGVQLFENATENIAADSANNKRFVMNHPSQGLAPSNKPLLLLYGSNFGSATINLKCKAPDGNFYPVNGLVIDQFGLYEMPVNSNAVLALDYESGGGSNISAFVFQGQFVY